MTNKESGIVSGKTPSEAGVELGAERGGISRRGFIGASVAGGASTVLPAVAFGVENSVTETSRPASTPPDAEKWHGKWAVHCPLNRWPLCGAQPPT